MFGIVYIKIEMLYLQTEKHSYRCRFALKSSMLWFESALKHPIFKLVTVMTGTYDDDIIEM